MEPIIYVEPLETGERVWRFDPGEGRVIVEQAGVELVHDWQDVPEEVREGLRKAA